jgi:hypothetical protein
MLSTTETRPTTAASLTVPATDRRFESREPVNCDLWMVDHAGATVLRCRCLDASDSGMRLRAPLGYGVAEGQRYELRSHLPGTTPSSGFGLVGRRWATVIRTQIHVGAGEDHLEVGVVLEPGDSGASAWHSAPVAQT